MKGKTCSTNLIPFCEKETCLVDEAKAVAVVYPDISKAFDTIPQRILPEKLPAHGLDGYKLHWVKNRLDTQAQRVVVHGVNLSWWPATSMFPRAQYCGQFCLVSLLMTWTTGSSAPSVSFQVTSSWAGMLICFRVEMLHRGIWTGWINGPIV